MLLDLVRKQQINIYDIPIAQITAQYLEYMRRAADLDIELGSEFVYMAATLIHMKSKMLLPQDPELEKISPEGDPRRELVERLLEHERFKHAAEMLHDKRIIEEAIWSNPQIEHFQGESDCSALAVTLFDLAKTFQEVLERAKSRPIYEVGKENVSIPEMIEFLCHELKQTRREVLSTTELFERQRSRRAMICLFLAILELVRSRAIELAATEISGELGLRRGPAFDDLRDSSENFSMLERQYHG